MKEPSKIEFENGYDVVIIGAGPVGLSLALYLSKNDISVLLLEKNESISVTSRAPAIWPRTQEILEELGIVQNFLKTGIIHKNLNLWDADAKKVILEAQFSCLRKLTQFPQLLVVPQSDTEKLLLDELKKYKKTQIMFSCEFLNAAQFNDKVEITVESYSKEFNVKCEYLIGCDGAHSKVRETIGAKLEGMTYPLRACLADVRISDKLNFDLSVMNNQLVSVAIRIKSDLWRLIFPFPEKKSIEVNKCIEVATHTFFPKSSYEVTWTSNFSLHNRMSSKFLDRRIVLAGDAAHLNSPVGGQGMNSGIQDSAFLGQLLIHALQKDDPSSLEKYAIERKQEVRKKVNKFTDKTTQIVLYQNGKYIKTVFRLLDLLMKIPILERFLLKRISMLR